MSRPNRDFKLADDDSSTNDFIANVAKSAPKKKIEQVETPINIDRGSNSEPWTSDIYTRLNGDGSGRRRGEGFTCMSVIVLIFSIILLLAGAGLIVIAAIQKSEKLLPICPACDKTMIVLYVGGAFVIFVGIVGALAAKTRSKALAIPYCILLGLVGLGFLGLAILVIVLVTNTNGLHLDEAWVSEVKDDPESVCQLQQDWQCSGYSMCCNGVITNGTTTTTAAPTTTVLTTIPTTAAPETNTTAAPETSAPETTTTPSSAAPTSAETTTAAPTAETTTPSSAAPTAETTTTTEAVPTNASGAAKNFFAAGIPLFGNDEESNSAVTVAASGGTCFTADTMPVEVEQQCVPGCASNVYEVRCDQTLKDKLKDNLAIILSVLIPGAVLSALMCFLAIRMTRVDRYLEE